MADPSPDADADLMLCVKQGGPGASDAFAQLVTRWKQPVMAFVFRTLPDPDEAEDLAQGVFVQLWRTAGRYQPTARFSTFLFTLARNLCLNEVRRRKRHPAESLDEGLPEDESHPARQVADRNITSADVAVENSELHAKVSEALADLPEKQRTALILCREGELSYEEIAAILETSVPATKSLIHRAREVLKARLKPYLRTGEWSNS
ncbi:MAG: sigma-70 family RNA polymerase sigma factor [Verrucomicrobiales bacterium]|nr:sigma-70 family RNA polymerase sigma factor [Verrucomicrobiales bacterium]